MDLSRQWCTHHRDKANTAHLLIGPYGTQEPSGYATLCGSLSGAKGWHPADRADPRCSRCSSRHATVPAVDDQPTRRAAQQFWNTLESRERSTLISGTAHYDEALVEKLVAAGMVLVPGASSDNTRSIHAREGSTSTAVAGEQQPGLFLARELILIIDLGDPAEQPGTN